MEKSSAIDHVSSLRKLLEELIEEVRFELDANVEYPVSFGHNGQSGKDVLLEDFRGFLLTYLPEGMEYDYVLNFDVIPLIIKLANSEYLKNKFGVPEQADVRFEVSYDTGVMEYIGRTVARLLKKVSWYSIMMSVIKKSRIVDKNIFKHFVFGNKKRNVKLLNNDWMNFKALDLLSHLQTQSVPKMEKIETLTNFAWLERLVDKNCRELDDLRKRISNDNDDFVLNCALLCDIKFTEEYYLNVQNLLVVSQILIVENIFKYYENQINDCGKSQRIKISLEAVKEAVKNIDSILLNEDY